ncbi:putative glutamine-serine rich protein MS8 [Aspergillus tanneri]|nr:uncharacterized protein ATNIH1004_005613 [Aspergillus tanneri]KAA8646934.1 hypothetical protein ATNIH1004_005613 [Aspergillus tanneri]
MSDSYNRHNYNQYGSPQGSTGQYGGYYQGQPINYPPRQDQYGQSQHIHFPPTPPYETRPNNPYYGPPPPYSEQAYAPPHGGIPQGGYTNERGYHQDMNYGYGYSQAPYAQQQEPPVQGESASYYNTKPEDSQQHGHNPGPGKPQGEKGLGSSLLGAGAGGLVGHKLGGGLLSTAGGALAGAAGMGIANKL